MVDYSPMPILFRIGSIYVYSKWFFIALGLLISIAILIAVLIRSRNKRKINFINFLDIASPFIALFFSISWIGLFLAWGNYGMVYKGIFSVSVNNVSSHPYQLYFSAGYFLIFLALLFIGRTRYTEKDGNQFLGALILASLLLITVDFFVFHRQQDYILGMSKFQFFGVVIGVISTALITLNNRKDNRKQAEAEKKIKKKIKKT
ncbi:MAG: prolipoprotein diacylglyceryl transferase family protein [archaeon]